MIRLALVLGLMSAPPAGAVKPEDLILVEGQFKKLKERVQNIGNLPEDQRAVEGQQIRSDMNVLLKDFPDLRDALDGSLDEALRNPSSGLSGPSKETLNSLGLVLGVDRLTNDPNDSKGHKRLGWYHYNRKEYEQSLESFGKAIENGDKDPGTWVGYAASAHRLGDYPLASEASAMALRMDPGNRNAFSILMLSKDRKPQAVLPSVLKDAGRLQELQQPVGPAEPLVMPGASGPGPDAAAVAEAARQAAMPTDVQRSAAITRDAASALGVRDYTKAHGLATEAIGLNPQNAQAYNYRAIAGNKLGRYRDAVGDASASLKLAPGSLPALQSRALAFNKQRLFKEAMADANSILEADPRDPFAYQNLAFALGGLGQREDMIEALRRSAELDPRFKDRYEKALQLPQDADVALLFDDGTGDAKAAAAEAAPKTPRRKRFAFLAANSAIGGILVALGLLHVFSPTWREKVRSTVRRVIGGAPAPAEGADLPGPAGSFWGQYELVRELGTGGMGVVYEARDVRLERPVAIKKMRDEIKLDPHERSRFLSEARMVASLHHANIVDIYSIVEDQGDVYLVFEYVSGKTLGEILHERGALPFEAARRVIKGVCEAVEYAHRHKVIHRDIKPSNIMIAEDGTAKVMDFGVARQAKDAVTKMALTNTVVGTPPYMAPEQEQGTVRVESDVYSIGIVLYECLTGQLPFAGSGAGMLLNKINGRHAPLSAAARDGIPPGLDEVVSKVLHPDPDKRYRTASELLFALDSLGATRLV